MLQTCHLLDSGSSGLALHLCQPLAILRHIVAAAQHLHGRPSRLYHAGWSYNVRTNQLSSGAGQHHRTLGHLLSPAADAVYALLLTCRESRREPLRYSSDALRAHASRVAEAEAVIQPSVGIDAAPASSCECAPSPPRRSSTVSYIMSARGKFTRSLVLHGSWLMQLLAQGSWRCCCRSGEFDIPVLIWVLMGAKFSTCVLNLVITRGVPT